MKKILLVCCLIASSCAFSAQYFYCSKTYNYIYLGNTIESVKQLCGNPVSETTQNTTPVLTKKYLEYVYQGSYSDIISNASSPSMVIDFVDEKVESIKVEGKHVDSTTYCRSYRPISVGDSLVGIRDMCGQPTAQYENTQSEKQKPVKETILTYRPNEYLPATQLHFYDGKLVSIEP